MKKIAVAAAFAGAVAFGSGVQADSTGCGLGTMVFEGQSGIGPQILAVTTNGTFGNQTFGISTGTLGCEQDGTVSAPVEHFMSQNLDAVARDMARGEGEALETLAALMEIDAADRAEFYAMTRENFEQIFPSADVTAGDAIEGLVEVLSDDATLSQYVA